MHVKTKKTGLRFTTLPWENQLNSKYKTNCLLQNYKLFLYYANFQSKKPVKTGYWEVRTGMKECFQYGAKVLN